MDKIIKISKQQAIRYKSSRMKSLNWKLPTVLGGTSVVYAEFAGAHGKVKTKKDRERVYYILEGKGEFEVEGETIPVEEGDVIAIPSSTWYNYRPKEGNILKILLFMDLWNS
jgi:mannose-6-phosphate isomerase-like protein (cupin superfamily)